MERAARLLNRLRIRDLQMLEIIAESGSMARAAAALHLSQPAISKAVADLENRLGVILFERSSRGVHVTTGGEVLLSRSRAVLDELKQAVREIDTLADPRAGSVRIGVSLAQALFITDVIACVSAKYPKIVLQTEMAEPFTLIRALRNRELDIAICRAHMAEPDLHAQKLFRDRTAVVAAPGHPVFRRRKLDLGDLRDELWALPPPATYPGELIRKAFEARKLPMPSGRVITQSFHLRLELMENAGFLTVAAHSMITHPSRRGRMKVVPVSFQDDAGPMAAVTVRERRLTKTAELVLHQILSTGSQVSARE